MPNDGGEHDAGDREPAERADAEVADDRGVGQEVERLGDERPERRDRQAARCPGRARSAGPAAASLRTLRRRIAERPDCDRPG